MDPAVTSADYCSYMVSPYNRVFRSLGYPELDIKTFEDGEWAIIQYHRTPIVPSVTPWSYVLTGIKNTDKTLSFFQRWAQQLDLEKRAVWEEQKLSEERARREAQAEDERSELKMKIAMDSIRRNDGLLERIARNGTGELTLRSISRHIPNHRFRKGLPNGSRVVR